MNHLNEDQLLNYVLETLDINDISAIQDHLEYCSECKIQLEKIKKELNVLQSFDPKIEETYFFPRKSNKINYLLKIAAVLVLGFLSGFLTSDYFNQPHINVRAQTIIPKSPTADSTEFVVCPNVDILY